MRRIQIRIIVLTARALFTTVLLGTCPTHVLAWEKIGETASGDFIFLLPASVIGNTNGRIQFTLHVRFAKPTQIGTKTFAGKTEHIEGTCTGAVINYTLQNYVTSDNEAVPATDSGRYILWRQESPYTGALEGACAYLSGGRLALEEVVSRLRPEQPSAKLATSSKTTPPTLAGTHSAMPMEQPKWLVASRRNSDHVALMLDVSSVRTVNGLTQFETLIPAEVSLASTIASLGKSKDWILLESSAADCGSRKAHMYRRRAIRLSGEVEKVLLDEQPSVEGLREYPANALVSHALSIACNWTPSTASDLFSPSPQSSSAWTKLAARSGDNAPYYLDTDHVIGHGENVRFITRIALAADKLPYKLDWFGAGGPLTRTEWLAANCSTNELSSYAQQLTWSDSRYVFAKLTLPFSDSAKTYPTNALELIALREACQIASRRKAAEPIETPRTPIRIGIEFFPPSPEPAWHKNSELTDLSQFVESRSIQERGGRVLAWIQTSGEGVLSPNRNFKALSVLRLVSANCSRNEHALLVEYFYDGTALRGAMVDESRPANEVFAARPATGSYEEAELRFACRSWETKQAGGYLETTDPLRMNSPNVESTKEVPKAAKEKAQRPAEKKVIAPPKAYGNPF